MKMVLWRVAWPVERGSLIRARDIVRIQGLSASGRAGMSRTARAAATGEGARRQGR
jgi:hypothetical protein